MKVGRTCESQKNLRKKWQKGESCPPFAIGSIYKNSDIFWVITFSQFSDAWNDQIENRPSQILISFHPNHIEKTFGYIKSLREIRWVSESSLKKDEKR